LKTSTTKFYLNAFSLASRRLRIFDHTQLTPDIYNGAQAMFMLLPPVATEHDLLTTGATRDPTGLQAIWIKERDNLKGVLAMDPLTRCFWRKPTDAYDAFQLMLMNPIVALQQFVYGVYAKTDALVNGLPANSPAAIEPMDPAPVRVPRLFGMPVAIVKGEEPTILKWTHANAVALQDAGYRAALPVAERLATHATDTDALVQSLSSFRFAAKFLTPEVQPRSQQFLEGIFGPMFDNFTEYMNWINQGRPAPDDRRDTPQRRTRRSRTVQRRRPPGRTRRK
jgi:hypothetical protein